MKLLDIKGRPRTKNLKRYKIDWAGPSRSKAQKKVKDFLYPYWKNHTVYEEMPVYGTRMAIDIVNATHRIAVEVQGDQHNKFVKYFHGSKLGFADSQKRDLDKYAWLELNQFLIVEIFYDEIDSLCKEFFEEKIGVKL